MKRWNIIILALLLVAFETFYVRAQGDDGPSPITVANAHEITQLAMLGRGFVSALAWSPDGKTLAVASSVGVWLYNGTDLTEESRLLTENIQTTSATFSPDGTLLAVGTWNSTVQMWDVQTGQRLHLFQPVEPQFYPAGEVAFSPDGTVIAAGHSDGKVRLWDVATGEIRATLDQTYNMIIARMGRYWPLPVLTTTASGCGIRPVAKTWTSWKMTILVSRPWPIARAE